MKKSIITIILIISLFSIALTWCKKLEPDYKNCKEEIERNFILHKDKIYFKNRTKIEIDGRPEVMWTIIYLDPYIDRESHIICAPDKTWIIKYKENWWYKYDYISISWWDPSITEAEKNNFLSRYKKWLTYEFEEDMYFNNLRTWQRILNLNNWKENFIWDENEVSYGEILNRLTEILTHKTQDNSSNDFFDKIKWEEPKYTGEKKEIYEKCKKLDKEKTNEDIMKFEYIKYSELKNTCIKTITNFSWWYSNKIVLFNDWIEGEELFYCNNNSDRYENEYMKASIKNSIKQIELINNCEDELWAAEIYLKVPYYDLNIDIKLKLTNKIY